MPIDPGPAPEHDVDLRSTIPLGSGRLEIMVTRVLCQFDGAYGGALATVRHHSPSGRYRDSEGQVYMVGNLGHRGGEMVWYPAHEAVREEVERMCLASGIEKIVRTPRIKVGRGGRGGSIGYFDA